MEDFFSFFAAICRASATLREESERRAAGELSPLHLETTPVVFGAPPPAGVRFTRGAKEANKTTLLVFCFLFLFVWPFGTRDGRRMIERPVPLKKSLRAILE